MMRLSITILSVWCTLVSVSCNDAKTPKVIYEEEDPEPAASRRDLNLSAADIAKLRTWAPGSTAGNQFWNLRTL